MHHKKLIRVGIKGMKQTTYSFYMLLLLTAIMLVGLNHSYAESLADLNPVAANKIPAKPAVTPTPPDLNVKAYILIDMNSGNVLAEKNADLKLPPASLTKIMTLYVVQAALNSGQIKMDDLVRISKKAWKTEGSRMFIQVDTDVAVHDLLQGIIVESGNDACVALAEHVAGDESSFVNLMNQQAKNLGMTNSHFTDSNGLPNPQHYTSARDLAILARALIAHFPQYYPLYKEKWFTYNKIRQPNRNRLLWRDSTVDGVKTGHTDDAGYCLVSSALRNNTRLIAVVLGARTDSSRADASQSLLTYGYRFFETQKLYQANQKIAETRIWRGSEKVVPFGVAKDLYITVPTGQSKSLVIDKQFPKDLSAPITKGQEIGKLIVKLNDGVLATKPIIALQDIPEGGIWTRMKDSISAKIRSMIGSDKT